MSAPRTVGRYVIDTLAANGIDTAFGIPGVHNIELYRGLDSGRVRHVLANALTAIAQAASDSVPMLVIASTPVRASLGRHWGVLHELADQRAVAAGAARVALQASSAEEVRAHLAAAFAALSGPRPRPAYLSCVPSVGSKARGKPCQVPGARVEPRHHALPAAELEHQDQAAPVSAPHIVAKSPRSQVGH